MSSFVSRMLETYTLLTGCHIFLVMIVVRIWWYIRAFNIYSFLSPVCYSEKSRNRFQQSLAAITYLILVKVTFRFALKGKITEIDKNVIQLIFPCNHQRLKVSFVQFPCDSGIFSIPSLWLQSAIAKQLNYYLIRFLFLSFFSNK